MGIEQYVNAEKPEEKATITVKTNPLDVLSNAFRAWAACVKKAPEFEDWMFNLDSNERAQVADSLLTEAEKMTIPRIESLEDEAFFKPINLLSYTHFKYAGLFYTALLNNNSINKLVLPEYTNIGFWGYRLCRGIIEMCNSGGIELGKAANGGTMILKGNTEYEVGSDALGGIFINEGKCSVFGSKPEGGIFINNGRAEGLGWYPNGGVFINKQQVYSVDFGDADYIILNYKNVKKVAEGLHTACVAPQPFILYQRRLIAFPKTHSELKILLDKMKIATKGHNLNEKEIYDIAEKIKGYLNGN